MKSLVVEGKNDSLSTAQRKNINTEIAELNLEINKVAVRTTFNGNSLLSGTGAIASTSAFGVAVGTVGSATAGFGVNTVISNISLSGTQAGVYTFTATGTNLTLTNGTTNIAQSIALGGTRTAGTVSTLDFSQFGVSISLTHTGDTTAANIVTAVDAGVGALTRKMTVTNSGPALMSFQSGAKNDDLFDFQTLNVQTNGNAATGVNATFNTRLGNLAAATTAAEYNTAFDNLNTSIDAVIDDLNTKRATLGSQMNRVSYISSQLLAQSGNLQQSKSSIIDTDFAAETARLTKGQIMQQAATAMLAQANQMPNVILSLLK